MSNSFTPPSFLPAVGLVNGCLFVMPTFKTLDRKPEEGTLLGMPFNGAINRTNLVKYRYFHSNYASVYLLVSVIFLGIPLDLTGITGAEAFFKFDAASDDFCNKSDLNTDDFGFFFNVKCLIGAGCCPTYKCYVLKFTINTMHI